jgi:hypothetical protein
MASLGCLKRSKGGSDNWKAFARRRTGELIDRPKADDERYRLGTGVLWLIRGTGYAAVGCCSQF